MKDIREVKFHTGSKEELLPDFAPDFPYIATRVEMDRHPGRAVPWHWHGAAELSYTQRGCMKYHTPGGIKLLPAGSAVLVSANVLHTTTAEPGTVQLLHIFDPTLLAAPDSRIGKRYLAPLTSGQVEALAVTPGDPAREALLARILEAFSLPGGEFGYELRLRNALSEIWLALLEQALPLLDQPARRAGNSGKLKEMMVYIHEHFGEKLSVPEVAAAAYLSERECFRTFQEFLRTTPGEYMKSYRLQQACLLLREGRASVTEVGQHCGLGSSSYFGKIFREIMGCTPTQYRQKWQNIDS